MKTIKILLLLLAVCSLNRAYAQYKIPSSPLCPLDKCRDTTFYGNTKAEAIYKLESAKKALYNIPMSYDEWYIVSTLISKIDSLEAVAK